MQSKSLQTRNGNIYLVGGLQRNEHNNENQVLRDCFLIDLRMQVVQQEKMEIARFGSPLALVHDRYILALGGFTRTNDQTMDCEAFDTLTNHWFRIYSLPYPVANTSAIVMNN